MHIRVLLADDHRIIREGLKALIAKFPSMEVVAEAANGREAVAKALEHRPDVAVMDITMPEMSGIEATRRIAEEAPEVKVLVLSMLIDRSCVVECLKAGAKGYLIKDCAAEELLGAIRSLAAGDPFLCARITDMVIRDYTQNVASAPAPTLSQREREVLQQIADGKNTKEISFALGVSVKTVEVHRINIMKKLNLYNIAALIKYALREGLTSME